MRKLKTSEVAAYLPYELMVKVKDFKKPVPVIGICQDMVIVIGKGDDTPYYDLNEFKPVLRPLNDLGLQLFYEQIKSRCLTKISANGVLELFKTIATNPNTTSAPYWFIDTLIECKFDVFGLIEAGLAIDINTLTDDVSSPTKEEDYINVNDKLPEDCQIVSVKAEGGLNSDDILFKNNTFYHVFKGETSKKDIYVLCKGVTHWKPGKEDICPDCASGCICHYHNKSISEQS